MTEEELARLESLLLHAGPHDIGGWEEVGPLMAEIRRLQAQLAHYRGTCDDCGRTGVLVDGYGMYNGYTTVCAFDRGECKRLTQERKDALIAEANREWAAQQGEG